MMIKIITRAFFIMMMIAIWVAVLFSATMIIQVLLEI